MKLPRFSSLYGRIFAVFWLTLLLVVLILLLLPNLDPRTQHTIPQAQQERFQESAASIASQICPRWRLAGKEAQPLHRRQAP